jgi:hypothetical protein
VGAGVWWRWRVGDGEGVGTGEGEGVGVGLWWRWRVGDGEGVGVAWRRPCDAATACLAAPSWPACAARATLVPPATRTAAGSKIHDAVQRDNFILTSGSGRPGMADGSGRYLRDGRPVAPRQERIDISGPELAPPADRRSHTVGLVTLGR